MAMTEQSLDRAEIERLKDARRKDAEEFTKLGKELDRLRAQLASQTPLPLPAEIEGLIERLCQGIDPHDIQESEAVMDKAAATLRSLAHDRESLFKAGEFHQSRATALAQELERTRDDLRRMQSVYDFAKLTAERDVLAQEVERLSGDLSRVAYFIEPHAKMNADQIIAAIRQLNTERDELEAERDREIDTRLRAEAHLADAIKAHEGSLRAERVKLLGSEQKQ